MELQELDINAKILYQLNQLDKLTKANPTK